MLCEARYSSGIFTYLLLQNLRDNMILNVGDAHIVVNILKEREDDEDGQ